MVGSVDAPGGTRAPGEGVTLRFGGYVAEGVVFDVPGARFHVARASDGERVLVQAVDLRAPRSDEERQARSRVEKLVGARTAELVAAKSASIRAHGVVDRPGDERTIFWVLGLAPGTRAFGEPPPLEPTDAARRVARALEALHARGLSAPLLGRGAIRLGADGGTEILGVPILVEADWVAAPTTPWAPAPGEGDRATIEGDLHRLVGLFDASAAPPALALWLERLGATDPTRRPPTARAALVLLEALLEGGSLDPHVTAPGLAPGRRAPSSPFGAAASPVAFDASELQTSIDSFRSPTPTPPQDAIDAVAAAWAPTLLPEGASPWSEVVTARSAEGARAHFTGFPGELPALDVADVPEGPLAIATSGPFSTDFAAPAFGAPTFGASTFGASTGALDAVIARPVVPAMLRPSVPPPDVGPSTSAAHVRGVLGELAAPRFGPAIALALVVSGLAAYALRGRPDPIAALPAFVATPSNEVVLETEPPGAWVVAELDGRVLGQAPLRFVVPTGAAPVVLVAADGAEPLRVVLPDRGQLVARLPAAQPARPCRLGLPVGVDVELVGTRFDGERRVVAPGIVRASKTAQAGGPKVGARLVRCESDLEALGFERVELGHVVRISAPAGAQAWLDGEPLGVLPAQGVARAAFVELRVVDAHGGAIERWVAAPGDLELRMPAALEHAAREDERGTLVVTEARLADLAPASARADAARGGDAAPHEPAPRVVRPEREGKAERALGHLKTGTELAARGELPAAERELRACLRASNKVSACHRALGDVLRRREAFADASTAYRRYLELEPDAPDAALVRRLIRDGAR
jgi:hypothetical protein